MTIDTSFIWEKAARSDNPCPVLLLGRSREEYFAEVEEVDTLLRPVVARLRERAEFLGRGLTLLEIGPGLHRFPRALHEKGLMGPKDVLIGIDIIDKFLEQAPRWMRCEFSILNVPNNSVDFAYSFCVFQHLPAEEREFYAEELQRVVRPGGYVLIQFPNAASSYYVRKPTLQTFTPAMVARLFPTTRWWVEIRPGNLSRYFLLKTPWEIEKEKRELFLIAQRK